MTSSALDSLRTVQNLTSVWADLWRRTGGQSSAGVDGVTPAMFRAQLEGGLRALRSELERGYKFSPLRGVAIPKQDVSKFRLICVPTVADRIVQRALLNVIEPRSAKLGIENAVSYGFVKRTDGNKSGTLGARRAAVSYRQKWPYVFKADISSFFDNIQRKDLSDNICRLLNLRSLSALIRGVIACEVQADDGRVSLAISQNDIRRGRGLRQGMPLSPLFSNVVLRDFDRVIGARFPMVRYADDLIVFSDTKLERDCAADLVANELDKIGLKTSAKKTFCREPDETVEFLGMELGLAKDGKTYCLRVSDAQIKSIRATFQRYHGFDAADKDGLTVIGLFRRLEQMRLGYISAYQGADNYNQLKLQLDTWVSDCSRKVYGSIFGQSSVSKLNRPQRRFLMLE